MNWRTVLSILLPAMLIFSVFAGCTQQENEAVASVRRQVEELPTVEEFQAMDEEARLEAYNRTQAAYDAYMALSEAQRQQIEGAEEIFASLFDYFNAQVMPLS